MPAFARVWPTAHHLQKPGIRFKAIRFGRFHQGVKARTGLGAGRGVGEQPRATADGKGSNGPLRLIVVDGQMACFNVADQSRLESVHIGHRLTQCTFRRRQRDVGIEPVADRIQDGLADVLPGLVAFFDRRQATVFFDLIELGDHLHHLVRSPFLSFGLQLDRIDKASACMDVKRL